MKSLITILATFIFSASAFGAIEFSEDQVAASADPAAAANADAAGNNAPSSQLVTSSSTPAPAAAMAQSQATGAAVGSMADPGTMGGVSGGGGGGGGGNQPQGPPADNDLTGPDTPDTPGIDTAPDPMSIPEPSTVIVWSVLGMLGLVAFRRRSK